MTTPSSGGSGSDDSKTSQGDADAVEKTSYVVGQGTDPQATDPKNTSAAVRPGGPGLGTILLGIVVLLIALIYGIGFFR